MLQILRSGPLLILFVLTCSCGGDFPADVVDIHNEFREVHGVPPLKLDDELTKKADELAKLATKKGNLTKPQSGENTYMLCTSYNRAVTAKEAVEAWYDEVCNTGYSFAEPNNENAHAFTQSVWKDSSRLGIAKSVATNVGADGLKCTFVIALYRPPGNIELKGAKDRDELFRENIFKGSFNNTYCDKFKDAANKRQLLQIKDSYHAKQGG